MTDTIFALSSGAPPAAIAIIRVSGPAAHKALERLAGTLPPARTLALRSIKGADGAILDQALVVNFPPEGSVTGEPLAELHLHGGRATVDAVLEELGRMAGLRAAKAGEFTWQAFQNGRMDLVEVESLADLLRSETESQRRAAMAGLGLGSLVEEWRVRLLHLSALVEATLDQSDEDDVPTDTSEAARQAGMLADEIGALLDRPGAERLFDGVRVVFAGPPNAGKSTLINALAQREVAIVSPRPGTTRDVIEAPVSINGVPFILTDTAGLRADAGDEVEQEGIARAERRLAEADIVVWMGNSPGPSMLGERIIQIFPRADQNDRLHRPTRDLRVSAVTGEGLDELTAELTHRSRAMLPASGEVAVTRRQRNHLERCHTAIVGYLAASDELIAAEHLRLARLALDDLTGRSGVEDMLSTLFGKFCIGK